MSIRHIVYGRDNHTVGVKGQVSCPFSLKGVGMTVDDLDNMPKYTRDELPYFLTEEGIKEKVEEFGKTIKFVDQIINSHRDKEQI